MGSMGSDAHGIREAHGIRRTCLQIRVGDPIDERVSSPDSDPDHAKSKEIRRVRPGGLALSASFLAVSASSSSSFDSRRSVLQPNGR